MKQRLWLLSFVLTLVFTTACAKQPGNPQAATPDPATATTTASNESSGSALPFAGKATSTTGEQSHNFLAPEFTVPSGTPVTVRLQSGVSSATSSSGDRFDAVLDAPLVVAGKTLAPSGAAVSGKVVSAHRSGRLQDPGSIRLALASLTINGKSYPVSSSSVSAKGASHKKRNWAMVGGGAGGGALIGGLLGGGKGALIGSAVGAGAGTTTAYATGKKDVAFGAERRLTFRTTQPIVVR